MSQDKDWKLMLEELESHRSAVAEKAQQDVDRGRMWQWRLTQVFNGKAATRVMPRMTLRAEREYREALKQAHDLAGTLIDKIVRKELGDAELNAIGTWQPGISSDPLLKTLYYPVRRAARVAWEIDWAEEMSARNQAQAEDTKRREMAVFSQYLSQNPDAVAVMQAAMPHKHGSRIDLIGERLGRVVTLKEAKRVASEVNSVLRDSFLLKPVECRQYVKEEFKDLPKEMLRDEHYDVYFKVVGYAEIANLVNTFGEPPASTGPSAAPA